jgi:septum formation protein
MRQQDSALIEFIDTTRVTFRLLDRSTIERYVAKERPLDCAGGFKSEGLGISLCESIDSADPSALIGLPLIQLSAALRSAGFEVP